MYLTALRYHSKCLKIARGKMKEFDMFTCPICDWRVKIPRDAARPKLEDLQTWADEMPTLPFQPEEEDLLNRIVDKAQAFRDFLSQFTHGNAICRTSEEMPTILFYLRKLEGAEVLLSDEINLFRQQVHKWQPIAPEPPPVLERSLSTRKPRPTKQQKIMKEMGIMNVDDLPQHLRTKTSMKRKNTDNSIGPSRPPLLQPAQMQRQGSGTASSHGRSDTPLGMPRQASTGNPPANGHYGPNQLFGHPYGTSTGAVYSAGTPSPMFSPTTSLPSNGLRESLMAPRFPDGPSAGPSPHDPSFPPFQTGFAMGMDDDDDIRTGLANTNGVSAIPEPNEMSSPHSDDMFLSMTNEDADTQNDTSAALEQEASQAQEALDMIRRASNEAREDGARDGDGAGEDPEKAGFDEFFVDGDGQA
jgi:[histone H3]-trimethyl-L-lysine4 demethylase